MGKILLLVLVVSVLVVRKSHRQQIKQEQNKAARVNGALSYTTTTATIRSYYLLCFDFHNTGKPLKSKGKNCPAILVVPLIFYPGHLKKKKRKKRK